MQEPAHADELEFEVALNALIKQYLGVAEVPEYLTRAQIQTIRDKILEEIATEVDDA